MKKRLLALGMVAAMSVSMFAGCGNSAAKESWSNDGKVVNIYGWNEEFKGFFEKYYTAQVPYLDTDGDGKADKYYDAAPGKKYVDAGIKFNWVINPSDGGVYQQKLDEALDAQSKAKADDKVDLFLAEADYITKYTNDSATLDITKIGVTTASTMYDYTVKAASSDDGVVKGVSFQCCPSALIYRRSIAKDVIGTDDPATVQAALDSWAKFDKVAADAKAKGYYMTASFAETFRAYSNNCTSPWVKDGKLNIDSQINAWLDQTDKYMKNGYTLISGLWGDEKNAQMFADGKTMCFFGPAWYFNFSMGNAQDPDRGCFGDWAIVEGPMAHFWGGTWILAANGTDNADIVADIMRTFTVNEDVCSELVSVENQYPNNKNVVSKFANDPSFGTAFLGGQNSIAIFEKMTDNIKWQNHTQYDQLLCEGLQTYMQDYFAGKVTKDQAWANYYNYVKETYPSINVD